MYKKFRTNITPQGKCLNALPPKVSDNSKLFTFATSSQHFTGCSSQGIRQEKERNPTQIGKQEIKLPLFAD